MRDGAVLKAAYSGWLSRASTYDVFATLTFKQVLPNVEGGLSRFTDDECGRTLRLLNDRLSKAVLGRGACRRGERLTFVPFMEGGDIVRRHAHVAIRKPADMEFEAFAALFRKIATRLDWVHREIDVRPIADPGLAASSRVIGYSLKEGVDAFVPRAAFI